MSLRSMLILIICAALLSGCHSRPPKVDCDGHLSAINAPAPAKGGLEKHP